MHTGYHMYTGSRYPWRTVYITHSWGGFPSSTARQRRGCQYRTTRLRKALHEMCTTPTFSAPTLLQLWRYRAWKIGPGGCDIHCRRTRYVHAVSLEMILYICMPGTYYRCYFSVDDSTKNWGGDFTNILVASSLCCYLYRSVT